MLKVTGSRVQLLQAARENEENRQRLFRDKMKDFPCSFNLGCSNLDIGDIPYLGSSISEPKLSKQNCKYIKHNLKNTQGEDYKAVIWRENLLTRILVELDDLPAALVLNENILKVSGDQNIVALGNAAFLYHQNNDEGNENNILDCLNKLKKNKEYTDLKIQALLEQAYEYRKFGGAQHNLCSIALFDYALPLHPQDERLQLMCAMVYRRCTHFGVYLEDTKNIDLHQFAFEAAKELFRLGNEARENVIRSAALIELAYLKHHDDVIEYPAFKNNKPLLDRQTWSNIVGQDDWKTLCFKAVDVAGNNLTEKVLKIAGQLFRYFRSDEDLQISEKLLTNAISIKPTNRAHHHLGLTYRAMAINIERKTGLVQRGQRQQWLPSQNNNVIAINLLPRPLENKRPQTLDERLKYMLKVPKTKLLPFSEDNPCTYKAVEQFKQAIIVSHKQNIPAFYDLGVMYVQMSKFNDAKTTIKSLIEVMSSQFSEIPNPIYLVNAYNLFGICYAMEAEKAEDDTEKMVLVQKSEEMLMQAVKMASCLAVNIPEFSTVATDLWKAFDTLQKKFKFEGSTDSKNILFKLCELIADYRCIEVIDTILSKDPSEWKNVEALNRCLECYLNLEDIDGALLFLDMISLHPEASCRFTRRNNPNVQKLISEVAKRTLSRFLVQAQGGHLLQLPDQIWKRMFQETFDTNNNSQKYDIVIVQDLNGDNEPEPGRSDNTSKYLKDILMKIFGLNVIRHHEEGLSGAPHLYQYIDTISKSHVAIFVQENLKRESPSLESHLEKTLVFNDGANESVVLGANSELESSTLHQEPLSVSNLDPAGRQTVVQEVQADNCGVEEPISHIFKLIISTCTQMCAERKKPAHILSVYLGEMQLEHLPNVLKSFSKLHLSDTDINRLSSAFHTEVCDKTVDLVMDIFKAITVEPLYSELIGS